MQTEELTKVLDVIESKGGYSSDKKELQKYAIERAINKDQQMEVEKYKVDKMIEAGLVKEQSQETISRNKVIDYGFALLKDNRFYFILIFIVVLFNSDKFWQYMFMKVGK